MELIVRLNIYDVPFSSYAEHLVDQPEVVRHPAPSGGLPAKFSRRAG
jgi:hypothetical protein